MSRGAVGIGVGRLFAAEHALLRRLFGVRPAVVEEVAIIRRNVHGAAGQKQWHCEGKTVFHRRHSNAARQITMQFPVFKFLHIASLVLIFGGGASAEEETNSAIVPAPQQGMEKRHAEKVDAIKTHRFDLLMVGDSITHNLENAEHQKVWNQFFAPRNAIDLGYSGGRTENTLWNLLNGELEGQSPKVVTLLIGTNNSDDANYPVVHTPEEIFEGTTAVVKLLREKCPAAKILVLRIFPRTNVYKKPDGTERGSAAKRFATNERAGELVASLADNEHVFFLDVNRIFLNADGSIDSKLMPDLLHPSPEGALAWARAMEQIRHQF